MTSRTRFAALTPHTRLPRDRRPLRELAITEVSGHLTYTPTTVTAWYRLADQTWAFRPDPDREALLEAIAEQYAGLAGLRLHLRRTTRPFPSGSWYDTYSDESDPLPDVPGAPGWWEHLDAARRHIDTAGHATGSTLLGVTFARRRVGDVIAEKFGRRLLGRGVPRSEREIHAERVAKFDELLGGYGLGARPATIGELTWMLYRSIGLGLTPPAVPAGDLAALDLPALTEQIDIYRSRYGSTLRAVNRVTDEESHIAILTAGRMEPLNIPEEHEPWLHIADRAGFPVELSSRIDLLGPQAATGSLERRLRMIRAQQTDYAEHGLDAPLELARLAERALEIGDQVATGRPVDSCRAHGWHRFAVTGSTAKEALDRAGELTRMYDQRAKLTLRHPRRQADLAREFIPGEPVADTGYLRRMSVRMWATALPQTVATVGDHRGDPIGYAAGTSRTPVFLDLHYATEVRERSGLAVLVSEPGGGKSTLMGALGYLAARRGVQVTLLDPSGPLARLADMPELAPYTRVLNLAGARPGTLAPYALIPTPVRTPDQYVEKYHAIGADDPIEIDPHTVLVGNARAERRMLVLDVCTMLLPPQLASDAETATALRHAVRTVPAEETSTLDNVIEVLDGTTVAGKNAAELLRDARQLPLAALFFGRPPRGVLNVDAPLTIITMAGLRLPDLKIERQYWSAEEALALPMLHTAHRLAVRRCYGGDMHRRKLVGLDEAHFMDGWSSGRSFLVRLARDSRKWNIGALVASQNPADILGLDVQNLVSTVFVGRIADDAQIAGQALRMLRVPVGAGYEQTLAALSQHDPTSDNRLGFREFVMRDVDGRVQKIRVDVSYAPRLLEHLDTTPGGTR